jgi:uncharacterized membrane protein YphA (DoxX/SURF4 family)
VEASHACVARIQGRSALSVLERAGGIVLPRLCTASAGQLRDAGLPFYRLTFWLFPAVEIVVGSMLIFDVAAWLAAVLVY